MSTSAREEVIDMFKEKDRDLDGKLSWEEFMGEETKTEMAFKMLDLNHDGYITKSVSCHDCWIFKKLF